MIFIDDADARRFIWTDLRARLDQIKAPDGCDDRDRRRFKAASATIRKLLDRRKREGSSKKHGSGWSTSGPSETSSSTPG